ncbi:MAG TPA: hypothetical protein VF277_09255 [Steroidobacteraceae bacterium]
MVIAIIAIILAIVAAILSVALAPKPQPPKPQQGTAPSSEDGQTCRDHFGTVWVDDSFLLAWKQMGTDPIKTSGGKK